VSCYSREIFLDEQQTGNPSAKPGGGIIKTGNGKANRTVEDDPKNHEKNPTACGAWVRKLRSGDEVKDIYHNCGNLSCPVCMPGTITDKAHDIEERFDLYERAKCAENAPLVPGEIKHVKPRHFAFTTTPAHQAELVARTVRTAGHWDPALFLDFAREEFNAGLKVSGLLGGMSVYHDARLIHPDTGETGKRGKHLIRMEALAAGNMKSDDPSWKIYDHIRKQKNPMRYYYFSPHFHVMAFGMAIDIREFERLVPGWTYHQKGNVDTPGGLARYLLSHMAMIEGRKAVSWFGRLSSKVLGKEELRTVEKIEINLRTGYPWVIIDSVYPEEIGKESRVQVTEWRAFFRTKHTHTPPEKNKVKFPKIEKRGSAPPGIREKGIMAMAAYCDEFGRL
jgi:hypothetical protein